MLWKKMKMEKNKKHYNIPLTLEEHFENLRCINQSIRELHSLYELLKRRLMNRLNDSRSVFVNFSLHDGTHSRSIIQSIERFLGEERIEKLSATDTFMLLICAYAHDYGMSLTYDKVYSVLGSEEFHAFLQDMQAEKENLEKEDEEAIRDLLLYLDREKTQIPLHEMYRYILIILQLYLRPNHWKGVLSLGKDFEGLFEGNLKKRFVSGSEGIADICMCHGQDFESVLELSGIADGIVGDFFHPRFIAVMIRIGDLLDIDNDRFPDWFMKEAAREKSIIPRLSILHSRKHESITHLLITEKGIDIRANCTVTENTVESVDFQECCETATLLGEWMKMIKDECRNLLYNWNEIVQPNFGRPPSEPKFDIRLLGRPFEIRDKRMQMRMSQKHVMKLLEGTSIYSDRYAGIRELVQNAVDASLLQLWKDMLNNRYVPYGLTKDTVSKGLSLTHFVKQNCYRIFNNYNIFVEVIKDLELNQVEVVVKDRGIGISRDEVKYISDMGFSRESNPIKMKLLKNMPDWLKPSGIFGIGLQSVFQLTDCIEFYTRQPNVPEMRIAIYSYGASNGRVETWDVPPNEDGMFNDNATPGTNVKIMIDPRKFLEKGKDCMDLQYFDTEFDEGNQIDIIYAEVARACFEKIRSIRFDYFTIMLQEVEIDSQGISHKDKKPVRLRRGYFQTARAENNNTFGIREKNIQNLMRIDSNPFQFYDTSAFYWDEDAERRYILTVRPCEIVKERGRKRIMLPDGGVDLYKISYKFNPITNVSALYDSEGLSLDQRVGFLEWDILILDDEAEKYVNIDREILKKGAISEEELLEIQERILTRWCEYFCNKSTTQKYSKGKMFNGKEGERISLIIAFSQMVPQEVFQEFLKIYGEERIEEDESKKVKNRRGAHSESFSVENYFIDNQIPVVSLWDRGSFYFTEVKLSERYPSELYKKAESDSEKKLNLTTLQYFPRSLIVLDKVLGQKKDVMTYYYHFGKKEGFLKGIEMDDAARIDDYISAINVFRDTVKRKNFESLMKGLFKPDNRYSNLIVDKFPTTFHKNENFSRYLDICISGYILSPFDNISGRKLYGAVYEQPALEGEILSSFVREIMSTEYFRKCVNYIIKQKNADGADDNEDELEKIIIEEYEQFIIKMYKLLWQKVKYDEKNKE